MYVVDVWKKMVRDVVVEAAEDKVGAFAKRIKIIGTAQLVVQPRSGDAPACIHVEILRFFNVVGHKKGEQQKNGLDKMHGKKRCDDIRGLNRAEKQR